ncbi:hypothetical protein NWQ33_05830 [Mycoplasmopsis cynos]|nr:hypothetical protein [Mycoplasmopsis cynos]
MLTQNEMKNKIKKIIDLEYLFEKINRLSRNKISYVTNFVLWSIKLI